MSLFLGIDCGTSGMRGVVIDQNKCVVTMVKCPWEITELTDWSVCWQTALWKLLEEIPLQYRHYIQAIAIDGTSSTVLVCDADGKPVQAPIMYNDPRGASVLTELRDIAPPGHTVLGATSSLAKLIWMSKLPSFTAAKYFLHQADWLGFLLHGQLGISDYHNALKLGYDVENLQYPQWLENIHIPIHLPQVLAPGTPIAKLRPEIAARYNFPTDCLVCAGTTDSIAAFLASGAKFPGEAVTSLGSTLVLKLLSTTPIANSQSGIYSHRLGDLWLTGGASNTGGAVLKHFFSSTELATLSLEIDISQPSNLDYYPLLTPGDRFPINDPNLPPRLEPRPDNPVEFLYGLLSGIARIEAQGYGLLQQLGAETLSHVYTAGGGAINDTWMKIRECHLGVPVTIPINTEAAYGTALLAMEGVMSSEFGVKE
ncbi:MAG: FGGY-family carbohydrate kinase [Calothrix sp. MO_192.B10]|nr:FGGY-family carbohydrate kinase [Calothrix sp. MO_192.B10]